MEPTQFNQNPSSDWMAQIQSIRDINRETALMLKEQDKWIEKHNRWIEEQNRWIEEHNLWSKEQDRRMAETDRQMKETYQQMKETDRQMKETDRQMKETDRKLKELANRFTSQSGHIIEGLMEPSALRIFQDAGYDVDRCTKNYKIHIKATGQKAEYDVILLDNTVVIVVEVKINCTKTDVDDFIKHMIPFRELFPEAGSKEVLGAMAAINYERGADRYAHEQGLFVIRVSDNDIFSLDDTSGNEMRKF